VVDHIVPIAAGGARLESSNHQSLCRSCNAVKIRTADAEAIRQARARGPYQRRPPR
jgi:5-methylcytosine-specific restriction endonuclease McrA